MIPSVLQCVSSLCLPFRPSIKKSLSYVIIFILLFLSGQTLANTSESYWQNKLDMAENLFREGQYERSEQIFHDIINAPSTAARSILQQASALNGLGILAQEIGDKHKAKDFILKSITLWEKQVPEGDNNLAIYWNNLGNFNSSQRLHLQPLYALAEEAYQKSLDILQAQNNQDYITIAVVLNNLAFIAKKQGKRDISLERYQKLIIFWSQHSLPVNIDFAIALHNLARLFYDMGDYGTAESLYKRSLDVADVSVPDTHPFKIELLKNISLLYQRTNKPEQVLDTLNKILSIYTNRKKTISENLSGYINSDIVSHKELFIDYLKYFNIVNSTGSQRNFENAFKAIQHVHHPERKRPLEDMLLRLYPQKPKIQNATKELIEQLKIWTRLNRQYNASFRIAQKTNNRTKTLNNIRRTRNRIQQLDSQLRDNFPAYTFITTPGPLSLIEAQDLLKTDEALIAYATGEKESFMMVVRKEEKPVLIQIPVGKEILRILVQKLRLPIDLTPQKQQDLRSFKKQGAYNIYQTLFKPAEKQLKGVKHIILVTDGALQDLPFNLLISQQPSDVKDGEKVHWLARRFSFSHLPSIHSLKLIKTSAKKKKTVPQGCIGFGDAIPLHHNRNTRRSKLYGKYREESTATANHQARLEESAFEIESLSNACHKNTESGVFLRKRATVEQLDLLNSAGKLKGIAILSFALHARFENNQPALIFTPTRQNTGTLTTDKIANLDMDVALVVLSACNTGLLNRQDKSGVSKLIRAFFTTGSRSILASYWSVESHATTKLMDIFFHTLKENSDINRAEALRISMMTLADSSNYNHPLFWASFALYGEYGSLDINDVMDGKVKEK